eukprot:PhF_6_TR5782/c0_g1_i2/m.8537
MFLRPRLRHTPHYIQKQIHKNRYLNASWTHYKETNQSQSASTTSLWRLESAREVYLTHHHHTHQLLPTTNGCSSSSSSPSSLLRLNVTRRIVEFIAGNINALKWENEALAEKLERARQEEKRIEATLSLLSKDDVRNIH